MSGSHSIDEGIKHLNQFAAKMSRPPSEIVAAPARAYTASIRSSISSVTTNNKLRGVGKFNGGARTGARVGVKMEVRSGAQPSAFVQAIGPLHLLERDNKDHVVPRTQGSRRLRTAAGRLSHKREPTGVAVSGRKPMLVGGVGGEWHTGPWKVSGSKGKHPFARGVRAADRAAQLGAFSEFAKEVDKLFKR